MAIYTVGRKRVILALLLTSALLLTLDLRGNAVIDKLRDGFAFVLDPVQSATGVVTNPLERVWHGIADYDNVQRENAALQDQVDRLIGGQAAAEAAVIEGQELQALYNLPSLAGIDTEVARVVGYAANNLDQVIEINKGSNSGITVGMPVVNQAGLVGRITQVRETSARVMLVTDKRYSVAVKVTSAGSAPSPPNTSPSGKTPSEVADAATTTTIPAPTTTDPDAAETLPPTESTLPGASVLPDNIDLGGLPTLDPQTGRPWEEQRLQEYIDGLSEATATGTDPSAASVPSDPSGDDAGNDAGNDNSTAGGASTSTSTTTTTTLPVVDKEFGALEGRGRLLLPEIRFLQDVPALAVLEKGDLVETAGGDESLAPTGIPVGWVANRADRPGSGGPLLDVELYADLSRLNYIRVVLYKPLSEVEQ